MIIVDESKMVNCLVGSDLAIPVVVAPLYQKYNLDQLRRLFVVDPRFDDKLQTVIR